MNISQLNKMLSEQLIQLSKSKLLVTKAKTLLENLPEAGSDLQEDFKLNLKMLIALSEDKRPMSLVILSNSSEGIVTVAINGSKYDFKISRPLEPVAYAKLKAYAEKTPRGALKKLQDMSSEYYSHKTKAWKKKEQVKEANIIPTAQAASANVSLPSSVANSVGPGAQTSQPSPTSSTGTPQNNASQMKPGTIQVQKGTQVKVINGSELTSYQQQGWMIVGQVQTNEDFGGTCAGSIASVSAPLGKPVKRKNKTVKVKEDEKPTKLKEDSESYTSLSDVYPEGDTKIYYCKSEFMDELSKGYDFLKKVGKLPRPGDLTEYVLVGSVTESDPQKIYSMMQGDIWSPAGEARNFINSLGVGHTSMSVGDIIQTNGKFYFLDSDGFKELGYGVD
jgi:hypothetical protein